MAHHDSYIRPYPTDWDAAEAIPALVDRQQKKPVEDQDYVRAVYTVLGYGMSQIRSDHGPMILDHPSVPESELINALDEFSQQVRARAGEHEKAEERRRLAREKREKAARKKGKHKAPLTHEPQPPGDPEVQDVPVPLVPKIAWEVLTPYLLNLISNYLTRK